MKKKYAMGTFVIIVIAVALVSVMPKDRVAARKAAIASKSAQSNVITVKVETVTTLTDSIEPAKK